jgi:hypothetical protein
MVVGPWPTNLYLSMENISILGVSILFRTSSKRYLCFVSCCYMHTYFARTYAHYVLFSI